MPNESKKIKVLVVDDSAFMRNVLTRLIEQGGRCEVVGKAVNGKEAVDMVPKLKPDVVTLDIEMPEMNGIEALQQIMQKTPVPVIMVSSLTEHGAQETITALECGAVDFMPKAMKDAERNIMQQSTALHDKIFAAAKIDPHHLSEEAAPASPPQSSKVIEGLDKQTTFKQARIVLIGSSTGGPKALQEIIPKLTERLPVPIVITQHMPENFTRAMALRLNEACKLNVVESEDGTVIEAGNVYICPGGSQSRIIEKDGKLTFSVKEDAGESLFKPSVDVMAASIATVVGADVICVMLTGMGNDGAKQYAHLRQQGAYVIAQDETTSVVYGMPKAVADLGAANEVVPLQNVVPTLERLLN